MTIRDAAPVFAAAAARGVGVSVDQVYERNRQPRACLARQIAMAAARRRGYTLPEIGAAFDRTHTTVLYAERQIAKLAADSPRIATLVLLVADTVTLTDVDRVPMPAPGAMPVHGASVPRRRPPPRPTHRAARPRRLLRQTVGEYTTTAGEARKVLLTVNGGTHVLVDRGALDSRVIERFTGTVGLLQLAAIAGGYLDEAGRAGRPVAREAIA